MIRDNGSFNGGGGITQGACLAHLLVLYFITILMFTYSRVLACTGAPLTSSGRVSAYVCVRHIFQRAEQGGDARALYRTYCSVWGRGASYYGHSDET